MVKDVKVKSGDMGAGQVEALLQQQTLFLQQTVEQQTNAHTQAMNAMTNFVRVLQADDREAAEQRVKLKKE